MNDDFTYILEPLLPKTIWICWLFGKDAEFAVHFRKDVPLYQRIASRIVLGSEWEREASSKGRGKE